MAIREKEQRKFRTLLKHMATHESYELDIFAWIYCLKYGFDKDKFFNEYCFMADMFECYADMDTEAIDKFESSTTDDDIEKYHELYEYASYLYEFRQDPLSAAADKFCEELLKREYIPSFLWFYHAKYFMLDAFVTGVVNKVNVFIKLGTLFDGVDAFITMDDKPNFETRKPWDSVALHDMNEYYAKRAAELSRPYAQKSSENFKKMLDGSYINYKDLIYNYDCFIKNHGELISVDSVVSKLLQCQQEGIKSCRKVLQNASKDEELFNILTHFSEDHSRLTDPFYIKFHDYFLKKEK